MASSPLITIQQRTTLSFRPVLNFRLIVRSLIEMFVTECIAFLIAETVVDLRVPQTYPAPEIGERSLQMLLVVVGFVAWLYNRL